MEVSGQLHTSAALPPGKEPLVRAGSRADDDDDDDDDVNETLFEDQDANVTELYS
jgi:hypothetical protein